MADNHPAAHPAAHSMQAFADLQSYCADLPDTDAGRFERAIVALIFDTGLPRWELADADLSGIDLAAGRLEIGGDSYSLTPFTVAAIRGWMAGQAGQTGQQPQRAGHSGGRTKRQPRGSNRRAAG